MRLLFTFAGGRGHSDPLVPVARAAQEAGHEVALTGRPAVLAGLRAAGFETIDSGFDLPPADGISPLLEPDRAREERVLRHGFAGDQAHVRADQLLDVLAGWRPDVVVNDETDFGAIVAAERSDVPHASVVVTPAGSFVRKDVVAPRLHRLRADLGLAPDPELVMLHRHLVLVPAPPSFRDPGSPLPSTARHIRPTLPEAGGEPVPTWLGDLGRERPAVYVTLGTAFNVESGDLFARVLAGVADVDADVVVTVGPQLDPASFGEQRPGVHVERFVPQSKLLPRCDAVVSHGGSGSVMGALTHGLPSVLLPMGADQPDNAARCEALGVGLTLDPVRATPADIAAAVNDVLHDDTMRRVAGDVRDEIAALPDPSTAVPLLEALVSDE